MPVELFGDIAYAALALLVAVLALYFALRVLGRIAKFVVTVVVLIVVAVVLWIIFKDGGASLSLFGQTEQLTRLFIA